MSSGKIFVDACRGLATEHTPIWLNRQAGRYMPEYHALKGDTASLDFFCNPEMAAQATLDAQRILGVDAAIMFADLLPILVPMGLELDYVAGRGPVFANPIRSEADVAALKPLVAEEGTGYIADTVKNIQSGLPGGIALIGFGGAPFTLASYAIEGAGSRNYVHVKKMMHEREDLWHQLMTTLTDAVIDYLKLQVSAGADALQLFDSWVGALAPSDFRRFVMPHLARLMDALRGSVPVIYFGTGNSHLLEITAEVKPDVLALDWRTPLTQTWDATGVTAVQGNLDPIVLCADRAAVEREAARILDEVGNRPGHIFNLGHGIIPETPVDNVKALVDFVQERSSR